MKNEKGVPQTEPLFHSTFFILHFSFLFLRHPRLLFLLHILPNIITQIELN
jgi:hypothetical protein